MTFVCWLQNAIRTVCLAVRQEALANVTRHAGPATSTTQAPMNVTVRSRTLVQSISSVLLADSQQLRYSTRWGKNK